MRDIMPSYKERYRDETQDEGYEYDDDDNDDEDDDDNENTNDDVRKYFTMDC